MNSNLLKKLVLCAKILAYLFVFSAHAQHPANSQLANSQKQRDPFAPLLPVEQPALPLFTTTEISTLNAPLLVNKIFKLTSVEAQDIRQQLEQANLALLSKKATVSHDTMTNSVIVKDNAEQISLIEEWIKQKDIPNQQVQITAHIISSSRTALQELGLEWGMLAGNSTDSHHNRYNRYHSAPGQFSFNVLKLGEGLLEMKLNALEKENLLSIIASPRLMASHKQPASIQQGTEIPYVTSNEKQTHVQFKDAVLGMDVTPTITRGDKIELTLKISHNSPDTALTSSQNNYLAINKQEIATSVTIKNNETLILGGIFQQKQEETEISVPFFSKVPILGSLFTNSATHVDRRVLIVFITPKLVKI